MISSDQHAAATREILGTALGREFQASDNPSRAEIESWDSLTHVEIVFMLEERFDVRFEEEEIAGMQSLADIVSLLEGKKCDTTSA
jgi:acyl carrier protein